MSPCTAWKDSNIWPHRSCRGFTTHGSRTCRWTSRPMRRTIWSSGWRWRKACWSAFPPVRRWPPPCGSPESSNTARSSPSSPAAAPATSGNHSGRRRKALMLTHEEIKRYSRHRIRPEGGIQGQMRIKQASVLCVGTGGLGSPLALYLAAAGVGRIGLVDFDVVDFTNLQRQILYTTEDVGKPKLQQAKPRLTAINPHIAIETHDARL